MNGIQFIESFGIDRAKRVVDNVVFDAEFYSEKTGSYYSSQKNDSVRIKLLKRAINEHRLLMLAKDQYETRLRHWNLAASRES